MTIENENSPSRRKDDIRPSVELEWDKPAAAPAGASAHPETTEWSILLTSVGHGLVHERGVPFSEVKMHHRIVNVVDEAIVIALRERVAQLEAEAAAKVLPKDEGAVGEPELLSTDESREYLVKFMEQNFTDKTYHRYIWGERGNVSLAGDFAWQMARALRMITAAQPVAASAAGLEGLTRYSLGTPERNESTMDETPKGEFFWVADVERLLATQSAKQGARIADLEEQLAQCSAVATQWASAAGAADGRAEQARNEALEEAALAVQSMGDVNPPMSFGIRCAGAIRALMKSGSQSKGEGEKA